MDLLEQALSGQCHEASALAKLYDYDLFVLAKEAHAIRTQMHQDKVFFNTNRHINPSNICTDSCKFCAFSASRKNPNPYEMTQAQILEQISDSYARGIKEVHVVSAHNPHYSYAWYFELFKAIKAEFKDLHLKAMTAAEVHFLSTKFNKPYQEVLEDMLDAGVDSMPGGGAEIFDEKVRKHICAGKVSSTRWLEIHQYWHSLGKMSNATMLFGHVESRENRLDHMLRLKHAQSPQDKVEAKAGGFNAFIPLLYQKDNNFLKVEKSPSAVEILKTIAIARIVLPNIPHIKAYWATLGLNLALVAQEFGADDLDGTIEVEMIQSAGGAKSKKGVGKEDLIYQIKDARFQAIERDSLYNQIQAW
ncbi:Menaquinone biosynthesis protein, SCO4494 family MqnE [Helicobacter sp. NHP19-003]|uniref:Menaquinone biosynthesis protein, SCO4494 family MqnE n=1 Tax=Helicobacter gastrocanis TaxID=2849641 RepID=A0ABM7SAH0_9HELI|nr:aminofutalosine synthase MqnE [Helicobacter sp. NHP19-003]BCZ17587.1 Menaquinone biosynthesis protein, SCO4494 family MqnE [Helicobacter sp. NHP19-003]